MLNINYLWFSFLFSFFYAIILTRKYKIKTY